MHQKDDAKEVEGEKSGVETGGVIEERVKAGGRDWIRANLERDGGSISGLTLRSRESKRKRRGSRRCRQRCRSMLLRGA